MDTGAKRLVVTGSSAGGIEALSKVLGGLASGFPAPIVVAQHLDPRVTSSLDTILAKRTALRVVSVADHEELCPGTVYVVPANRHVEINDGHVALRDGPPHPMPSIDLLFATAAQAYGERLVAIVLTGMGSDGSAGVRAVKSGGGTVMIEDPLTATFPSMPASLPASMVDIVAPADRLGAELEKLLSEQLDIVEDTDLLAALLKRINATSGIDFTHYKMPTIKRRLARQIKSVGANSLAEYLEYLDNTPGEYERLTAHFLIKVTEFFRDPDLFAWLQEKVIPEIVREARSGDKQLRLWSAGCATGEEAYSLAIAITEALGDEGGSSNVRIFATDVDEAAISFARRGLYPADALVNLAPDIVKRYFRAADGSYEVDKMIRGMTVFGQHDLAQRAPFPHIDLVLCRNVLIYFSKELQERTLQAFAFSLRNGGYLALGKAETPNPLPNHFEIVEPTLRLFRRFGERVAIPTPSPMQFPKRLALDERTYGRSAVYDAARNLRRNDNEEVGGFLMESTVGFVSVNAHYDIAIINAAARQMLNIHGTAVGEDLVHLAAPNCAPRLRSIVDAALHSEQPQVGGEEMEVPGEDEEETRYVTVFCYPKRARELGDVSGAALLIFDVNDLVRARHIVEARANEQAAEVAKMRALESEWRERRRMLLDANHQLLEANAELRTRMDALLIGAEEATASTEEIETLNEEMQATNEELETLNEESQATIEELTTTSDELETRTLDLQELVVSSEGQRQVALAARTALQAIVDALVQPMAAIGSNSEILAANREFQELRRSASESTVHIDDDSDAAIAFSVLLRRAATGEALRFTYEAIEASQNRTVYRGTVSPLGGEATPGGLMILERTS
ncbi:MAG: CheR family methyltransferase [Vulcanimicrobiaceae bacterium]